jgi:phosphopantothenate-cysteine ligase/phosphopantothenoylcysteine decarboxylase/phosphopantothenate--cysteine ligase
MNILVTAGNTQTPLDKVRCITNIFSGRTGARIAARAFDRGHTVTLLTSHPEVLDKIPGRRLRRSIAWRVRPYCTFADLESMMGEEIADGRYDAVIHAAAVSDYQVDGIFIPGNGRVDDAASVKVKSHHSAVWLRLVPAPKLVDRIRTDWGFPGVLVKFKLEVGVADDQLLDVAERSRLQSGADVMCANTLEEMHRWAWIGAGVDGYRRVDRASLPDRLLQVVEATHRQNAEKLPALCGQVGACAM